MGTMFTLPPEPDKCFGDFLKENGVITADQYKKALFRDAETRQGLIHTLLIQEHTTEDAIAGSLRNMYGLQPIVVHGADPAKRPFPDKLTDTYIRKNRIIPLALKGKALTIAVADPEALNNINDLKLMTGCSVDTSITTLSELGEYMERLGKQPAHSGASPRPTLRKDGPAKAVHKAGAAAKQTEPQEQEGHSEVIDFVNNLIMDAVVLGASDIHIESYREKARVRFRRDGVLQEMTDYEEFLSYNYSAVTTRIKILATLDISERRLPQDGGIRSGKLDRAVDIRVSVLPTAHGERVVMRILDPDAANFSLDQLGMPKELLANLRKAIHAPQGMILVTGPTGSGKSTTLYAVLKELNKGSVNILTAEDPVEYDLFGVGQVQVRDDIGLSFTAALRSFLRQDPEVIMVGEIRDKDTSDIAIKAALTGHLVLSTLHTNDAPSTITRLVHMGVPPYLLTSALSLVMAQRLARTNCPHCRVKDETAREEDLLGIGFKKNDLPEPKMGKGCDTCMNTGIKGRRAIHEVLPVSPAVKEAIYEGASDNKIRTIANKEGFRTMQEIGRDLVRSGDISMNEYKRILVLD